MPLLGDGSWSRAPGGSQHERLQMAQGPGKDRLTVKGPVGDERGSV